ncbi:hypothetical protein [Rothia sp. L_38]|uniref:hypothetical protein n=1 Tax=Rothia sp. L_38 TaxID=3422315 RepID=UPI003D6BB302
MAKAPTRCTLCTGTTKLTTITRPDTGTRSPICISCHSLVTSNAINQDITPWHAYTQLLDRLDRHFGRGLQLASIR